MRWSRIYARSLGPERGRSSDERSPLPLGGRGAILIRMRVQRALRVDRGFPADAWRRGAGDLHRITPISGGERPGGVGDVAVEEAEPDQLAGGGAEVALELALAVERVADEPAVEGGDRRRGRGLVG